MDDVLNLVVAFFTQMTAVKVVGWLASFFFAICGVPQAYECYRLGNAHGLSSWFILTWTLGEVLMIVYVLLQYGIDGPLLLNYAGNLVALTIIIRYKIFPRPIS